MNEVLSLLGKALVLLDTLWPEPRTERQKAVINSLNHTVVALIQYIEDKEQGRLDSDGEVE